MRTRERRDTAAVFGTGPELFDKLPRNTERVVIARKPGYRENTP